MKFRKVIPVLLYIVLLVGMFLVLLNLFKTDTKEISYSQALTQIESENVCYLEIEGNVLNMVLVQPLEGTQKVHHDLADPDGFWQKMGDQFAAQKQAGVLTDYN